MRPDPSGNDPVVELIVPRRPGPLRELPSARRRRDEVDELLDDMFGVDAGGAGKADLLLAVGGLFLAALGFALSQAPLVWFGAAVFALGLILPGRDLVRSAQRRRTRAHDGSARGDGYPLRVEHPAVAALVGEYRHLLAEAGETAIGLGSDAVEAGHLALVEVAGLLDGRGPVGSEVEYVAARRTAIAELRAAVREADVAARAAEERVELASRDAGVAAIEAHDETAGDSLTRMRALREVLDDRG